MVVKYDNCKDCRSECEHAGKDREFVCINGLSCKITKGKPQTNADRIRTMSDEELCEMLTIGTGGFDCGTCRDNNECDRECELHCAEWLKTTCRGR